MYYPKDPTVVAALAGVGMHLAVFRHGEWDLQSCHIFAGHMLAFVVAAALSNKISEVTIGEAARLAAWYVGSLYTSMLVYRAFFHRLGRFPGPFLARLSTLYITAVSLRKLRLTWELHRLHAQYGDYVRVAPTGLFISDPDAVQAIYSSKSPVSKGPWYNLMEPRVLLQGTRDKAEHARRRKIWDPAFTTKAIKGYEPHVLKAVNEVVKVIDRDHGQPIDMAKWFRYFGFDVMEDLAFSKSSNMVRSGKGDYVFGAIRDSLLLFTVFQHLQWLLPFFKRTPLLNREYLKFWAWVQDQVNERIERIPDRPDIFSFLLSAFDKSEKTKKDSYSLNGDANLIVVAGSDTVSLTLICALFELVHHPATVRALQEQLDALPDLSHDNLQSVALLEAIANETMRLHPPVPAGLQRMTPPQGLTIGHVHIPGDTIVQVSLYTVFRDPRSFEQPDEFIPERWTTRPELVKNGTVFIPFNTGQYACIGKRLALMEIRHMLARTLSRYDIAPAPEHNKEAFIDGQLDNFTLVPPSLPLIFTPRAPRAEGSL